MILDTNALSAAADDDLSIRPILTGASEIALPVIVIGEYRYGIAQSRFRNDYEHWLDNLLADCRVLEVAERTTPHYADIKFELKQAGKPIPINDLWIAALCRQYGLPLPSRDRLSTAWPEFNV